MLLAASVVGVGLSAADSRVADQGSGLGAVGGAQTPADAPEPVRAGPAEGSTGPDRSVAVPVTATPAAEPRRIRIFGPSGVSVTAEVLPVGVEADGSMTIPADPSRVGWYRFGPAPGSTSGSSVISGHVDTRRYGPGAFAALRIAAPGDDVVVDLEDGTSLAYVVTGRESFDKTRLPTEALFARDGAPRLTLVTCGGPFDASLRRYRDNLVITAVPVP